MVTVNKAQLAAKACSCCQESIKEREGEYQTVRVTAVCTDNDFLMRFIVFSMYRCKCIPPYMNLIKHYAPSAVTHSICTVRYSPSLLRCTGSMVNRPRVSSVFRAKTVCLYGRGRHNSAAARARLNLNYYLHYTAPGPLLLYACADRELSLPQRTFILCLLV